MASRSIICRNRRLRQIIDVWDTGKSWHFVITEFNSCFIIRSPSDLPFYMQDRITCGFVYPWAECYFAATHLKDQLDYIAQEQTIICRQLFAGHVVGFQPMKRKKNLHWNDNKFYCTAVFADHSLLFFIEFAAVTQHGDRGWNRTYVPIGEHRQNFIFIQTNRNRTVNYPFCSPQQSLNNFAVPQNHIVWYQKIHPMYIMTVFCK